MGEQMTSRNYLLTRRGTGIGDLSECDDRTGAVDAWSDAYIASIAANNVAQIGIGTETEVGLEMDRYPIRVVIVGGTPPEVVPTVCIRYWNVVNAAGEGYRFSRSPPVNTVAIENIYRVCEDFDNKYSEAAAIAGGVAFVMVDTVTALSEALYALLRMAVPTTEQYAQMGVLMNEILGACAEAKIMAYIKIGENAFVLSRRHGGVGTGVNNVPVRNYAGIEQNVTFQANYLKYGRSYPDLSVGLRTACAYSVSWMFAQGLFECYESREYVTLVVANAENKRFAITQRYGPPEYTWHATLAIGQVIDCSNLKFNKTLMAIGPAMNYLAGVNHYTFNHTTNGMVIGGPLLSALLMYKLYTPSAAAAAEEEQTRLIYETLHPVNKRGIANIFFSNSRVTSWGRCDVSPRIRTIELDAFLKLRDKPVPAGAHKAYLAGVVLERVLRQQWAAFLPWVGDMASVIDMISSIVNQGARSHVGAAYYTGMPGLVQGSQLDPYLPDLAQFIQTMARRDTLAMSPHLSPEVAARADTRWANLLKSIRGNDVTAVSAEVVTSFLRSTGTFSLGFDHEKPETWGAVAEASVNQAKVLGEILRNPGGR